VDGEERHDDASYTRLRHLQTISEAALAHLRFDELLDELLRRVTSVLGTDTAAVLLLDEESKELVARAALGLEEEVEAGVRIPLGRGFAGRIAAERRAVVIPDVAVADVLNPILRAKGLRSLLGAPLLVEGRVIGVLHVGTLERRDFTADDAQLLQLAADRMAVGIDHARLYEAEREARAAAERAAERLVRMESITQIAFHHLAIDEEVMEQLLGRLRTVLDADTAAVFELDDEEQTLVARASKGLERDVERGVRVPLGRGFAGVVAQRGEPVRTTDASSFDLVSPLMREQGIVSLLGVPLAVEGRLLGVLHVGSRERREFSDDDLALLELAAERLAVALDHSRLYEREHAVAETLQRSLLPEELPPVPGAVLASRYVPGAADVEVGGDWYDVIPLPGGRVGLAMGDVVSRGVRAASVMGQLRNALRAYALDGRPPAAVLERLHALLRTLERREMATLAYMVLDPQSLTYSLASAGHPPPLVLGRDGDVDLIEEGRSPPLGAVAETLFGETSGTLEPGATLLLYTDGLVERRDMWVDEGLERLTLEAAAAAGSTPDELCDRLLSALVPHGGGADDVALLALRLTPVSRDRLALRLPAEPDVLASLRRTLRPWLEGLGASDDEVYDMLVAVTEAAANAVEHAYGPVHATFEVEASASEDAEVSVVVRDQGLWRPPRGHNRGRGTLLMQELTDALEVTTGATGTEVRMSRRLARAGAPA
jgi:GAF domain-containing protein/anti-sigma regulatory factor (Ser/Thr protein kinase)